tara:strand:+ start:223 stop:705 length:483 start_codon:yes stop_codon:yes gene_type:complete
MDFLLLLADGAADKANTMFDMEFVKWLAGFLVAGYLPLLYYLKGLLDQRKDLLEKQVEDAEARNTLTEKLRKEIEEEVRGRFVDVVSKKDIKLLAQEEELKAMRVERLNMLGKQIEDAHKQEKALEDVSENYEDLVKIFKPILKESVEVLSYYRKKRERS